MNDASCCQPANDNSQGGFRFLMNNYFDMTRELKANRIAYDYWKDRIHDRVRDPRKAELLAPTEPPHPFGAKRLSLEQDFYDHFNKPNVDVIDIKTNPIVAFQPMLARFRKVVALLGVFGKIGARFQPAFNPL